MNWKDYRRKHPSQVQLYPSLMKTLPGWAWQVLGALLVFFVILGASQAGKMAADDIVVAAKKVVDEDITYDDVKAWVSKLPEAIKVVARFDIDKFWARTVTGKPKILSWPCEGEVVSYFGWRDNLDSHGMTMHKGIDISANVGTPVVAVAPGIVTGVRQSDSYGLTVEIEHSDGFSSVYAHLDSISVAKDQKTNQGDVIGTVGESGRATGPHLHFELRKNGLEIDPLTLLPPKTSTQ